MSAESRNTPRLDELVAEVTPRVLAEATEQAVARAREELADRLGQAIVERALAGTTQEQPPSAGSGTPERETAPVDDTAPVRDAAPVASPRRSSTAGAPAAATGSTRQTSSTARAEAQAEGRADVRADQKALYAFAIVPAGPADLAGVAGIDGETPLRIVQHTDLGLVVSEMRLDLMDDVSEEDLSENGALATLARRHDEVVRSVFDHGAVLPLRFGTIVADDDGAVHLLEQQADQARRRLAHLDGRREWGVRISRDDSTADEAPNEEAARSERREMTGTSYLASRRDALQESQRTEQETAAMSRRVEESLSEHAADLAHRGGGAGSGLLADLAYLVPHEREDDFLTSAEGLRDEVASERLALELTGPWPPYSFATLESGPTEGGVVGSA